MFMKVSLSMLEIVHFKKFTKITKTVLYCFQLIDIPTTILKS